MQSIAQRAFFFSIHFFSSLICCGTEVNTSYGGHLSNFPIAFEDGSQRSIRFSVFISVEYRYVGFIAIFSGFASISRHSARILFTLPKLLHCANTICEGRDYMFLLWIQNEIRVCSGSMNAIVSFVFDIYLLPLFSLYYNYVNIEHKLFCK